MIFAQLRNVTDSLSPAELKQLTIAAITLDPERDDVSRNSKLSDSQKVLLPTYQLLTGDAANVNRVLDDYGFIRRKDSQTGEIDHNNLFIVIDRGANDSESTTAPPRLVRRRMSVLELAF